MTEGVERSVFSKQDLKSIRQDMGPIGIPEDLLNVYSVAWRSNLDEHKKGSKDTRKSKKSDTSKERKSSNAKVATDTISNSSGHLATETISPTSWRKVQQDFTEVVPKSSSKKQRENKEKEKNNDRHENKRITNNNTNSKQLNDNKKNKKGGHGDNKGAHGGNKQSDEADLWDMPTGLSSEESAGLSEREMFELERKKFLALRHQPTAGGGVSKEGQYHSESDIIMDSMQSEQALQDDIAHQEVSGSSFEFQMKQPRGTSESLSESGIRSLTASDVMKGLHGQTSGGGASSSSEDMAWFGAVLGGDTKSSDEHFFSHFLSEPVMTTPVTPPAPLRDAPSDLAISSPSTTLPPPGHGSGGGGSSSKSSRLGSLLGIPLSPPANPKQPTVSEEAITSGIKVLNLPVENASTGDSSMGNSSSDNNTPAGVYNAKTGGTGNPSNSLASNQKSRDLLATLGFSPPRSVSTDHYQGPSFSPAGGIQHHHQHQHHHVDEGGNHSSSVSRGHFVFQQSDNQSPPLPPPSSGITPGKSTPLLGGSSPSPSSAGKSAPSSGGKRNTMSASSRLQLARMKQQGAGGTKKKIEVSSLFNKAPIPPSSTTSSGIKATTAAPNPSSTKVSNTETLVTPSTSSPSTNTVTSAVAKPVNVTQSSTQPVNGIHPQSPSISSSSHVTTNSKGASLLMKLKK